MKKTLVLGASDNPQRYSFLAVKKLKSHGHAVVAIGRKIARIDEIHIVTGMPHHTDIDTVTLYLNPTNQELYYDYILSLNPKRIIFNPGSENPELESLAKNKDIETLEACTLVMLATHRY